MRESGLDEKLTYVRDTFAGEDASLESITEALRLDNKFGINVSPVEGRLLQLLLKMIKAKKVVEVGLLYGYSTLWMARALPEDGKVISLESNKENYEQATKLLKKSECWNRIDLRLGDARENILKIEGPVDVCFIDADKGSYLEYLDWAEKNVRPGGLIIGDNTFLFGEVFIEPGSGRESAKRVKTMKEFNQRLADKDKYESILIPTKEGMTVALKK